MTIPIVYISGHGWGGAGDSLGRQWMLTDALSRHVPVINLALPDSREMSLRPPRPMVERVSPTYTVIRNAFALRGSRGWRRLGKIGSGIDGRRINGILREMGYDQYVLWVSAVVPHLLDSLKLDRLVYDCIDPCFTPEGQADHDAVEFALARRAKLVFATAESLHERMAAVNPNTHLLPNAAPGPEFLPENLARVARPDSLHGLPGPVVGYLGTVDWRFDAETVTAAAKALPDFTFCIVGRINADQEARIAGLRQLPNTIFPGAVSHEEGIAYTAHCDVAIIPFLPGPIGDAINPCKMYMYMMAGKPVVSTWTRECARHAPYVKAARTAEGFTQAIKSAASGDTPELRGARTRFALQNRWEDRAATATDILAGVGLLARDPAGQRGVPENAAALTPNP